MRLARPSLAALVLWALNACGNNGLQNTTPSLLIDGGPVDFGPQPVLTTVTRTIHFENVGRRGMTWSAAIADADAGPLDLDGGSDVDAGAPVDAGTVDAGDVDAGVVDAGSVDAGPVIDAGPPNPNGVFKIEPSDAGSGSSGTLSAGASIDELVTFNAPVMGNYSANFVLTTDDTRHLTTTISLTAAATTAAAIKVTPTCLDFGTVPAGQTKSKPVSISSVGTAPLQIGIIEITPPNAAFGVLGANNGGTIQNGTPATVPVSFGPELGYPNTNGAFTANLQIPTNDPNARIVNVCLTGTLEQLPTAVINIVAPTVGDNMIAPGAGTYATLGDEFSTAPSGDTIKSYQWNLVNAPMGSAAPMQFVSAAAGCGTGATGTDNCQLLVDVPGEFDVQLTVTDSAGQSGTTLQKIIGATSQDIEVELTWDTSVGDLDLHFYPVISTDGGTDLPDGGSLTGLDSQCDCTWFNPTPSATICDYGMSGPIGDADKLSGFGPDTVTYVTPNPGNYQVSVIYYSDQGTPGLTPNATVRFFLFGSVHSVFTQKMTTVGQQWNVGWISWPSQMITQGTAP